jgi:anti-sigma factor RsiW
MSEHLSAERMHDLLDDLVPEDEAAVAHAHLDSCARCREEHERLARLVAELRSLPGEARPPVDLWAGIEGRLEAGSAASVAEDPGVLSLPVAARSRDVRRRLSFTVPQLAAAAAVVALLSAGSVWMALSGSPGAEAPPVAALPEEGLGPAARMAAAGDAAYESAVVELEELVAANRDLMAPETARSLDESLRTIDEAMAAIQDALRKDPNSELLARLLVNQQRSKLRVLRQAATAVQARS